MAQIAIRVTDEQLAQIDAAIQRVEGAAPAGQRADYLRSAGLIAAQVEDSTISLRQIVERYREVCRRTRPALTPGEWRVICDACNGLWLSDAQSVSGIPLEVADYLRLRGPADPTWITAEQRETLPRRLVESGYAGLCAVADVVARFWARPESAVPGEDGWDDGRREIV